MLIYLTRPRDSAVTLAHAQTTCLIPLDTRPLLEVIDTRVVSKYFRLLTEFGIIDFPPTFKMIIFTFGECFSFVFSAHTSHRKFRLMTNFNGPSFYSVFALK